MSATTWYFARSAGIVAYLLLSASVLLGALMAGRTPFRWPRFAVEEVHRFLAILTGAFVVLHGGSLLLDRVVPIGLAQELVPFTSPYRPFAVGLGVCTAELLAAVGISNALRRRIPYGTWRKLHYLTLPVWLLASAHGILAGTDALDPWFAAIAAGTFAAVLVAVISRYSGRAVRA
ncbi:MAG TPA: ferric reductase-like transmembrane domain-containing protein [Gaiellaceae bacterium]|nr:ferric reductase-like transmembrane domain-containing protein [Gaiellaceae bacterium]